MRKCKAMPETTIILNLRERKLVNGLAEGLSTTEAMRKAGYADSTIRKQARRTVGKSRLQCAVNEILNRQGLTDEGLVLCLKEGLEAVKAISGKEFPDYSTRLKFLDIVLELKGYSVRPSKKRS